MFAFKLHFGGNHTFHLFKDTYQHKSMQISPIKMGWFFLLCSQCWTAIPYCMLLFEREVLTLPVTDCLFKDVHIVNCSGRQIISHPVQRSGGLTSLEDMESSSRAEGQRTYWPLKMTQIHSAQISFPAMSITACSCVIWLSLYCPQGTRAQGTKTKMLIIWLLL